MESIIATTAAVATAEQTVTPVIDTMPEDQHERLDTTAEAIKAVAGENTIAPDDYVADTSQETVAEGHEANATVNDKGACVDGEQQAPDTTVASQDEDAVPGPGVIDLEKKRDLDARYNDLINNPRFWENPNRIKALDDALYLPVYDDKSLQMFYNSASDELIKKAMALAIKNSSVPVMPTEQQICALAEEKHYEKYVAEPKRKAEKEAKKNAKKYVIGI